MLFIKKKFLVILNNFDSVPGNFIFYQILRKIVKFDQSLD